MLLDATAQQKVRDTLAALVGEVEILVYTASDLVIPGRDAPGEQRQTLALLNEVAALSDKLSVREERLASEEARALGLTLAPTILLREKGSERSNIRFLGLPGGYEFATLIEALLMLGNAQSGLAEPEAAKLGQLAAPVQLRVFVTPTCPYCPRAVLSAYKLAFHAPQIVAEGIEATEFPRLAERYRVGGVPDTFIHGEQAQHLLGAQPDHVLVEAVLAAAQPS